MSEDKLASIEEPEGGLGDGADAVGRGFCVVSEGDLELISATCEDAAILEFGEGFVFVFAVFAVDGDEFIGERERRRFGGGCFPRDTDFFEGGVDLLFFGFFGFLEERQSSVVHFEALGGLGFGEERVSEFDLKVHLELFVFFVVVSGGGFLFFFVVEIAEAEHGGALFTDAFEVSGKFFAVGLAGFFFKKLHLIFVDMNGTERDIRGDADILDGDVSGGEVLGDGEFEGGAFGAKARDDRIKDLDSAFAVGALSEDESTVVVFERARDDLGSRSGAVVDEDNDGIVGLCVDVSGVSLAGWGRTASVGNDHAFGEESVGDTDGLVEESARVVAQVEDQATQLFDFEGHPFESSEHLAGGVLLEVFDLDVGDVVFEQMGTDALDADNGADKTKRARLTEAFAHDPDHDGGSGIAAKFVDGGVEVHVDGGFITDADNAVFGAESCTSRWGVRHGADDGDVAFLALDHDAKAAEFAAGVDVHVFVERGRQKSGMDIECAEHTVDGGKLDISEFYVTAIVLFDKGKDGLELVGDIRDDAGGRKQKGFGALIDVDRDAAVVFGELDHDGGDGGLELFERLVEHLLWVDLLWVDVVFFDEPNDLFDIEHIGEAVAPKLGVCSRNKRNPRERSPSAPQAQRKEGDERCSCTSLHP